MIGIVAAMDAEILEIEKRMDVVAARSMYCICPGSAR